MISRHNVLISFSFGLLIFSVGPAITIALGWSPSSSKCNALTVGRNQNIGYPFRKESNVAYRQHVSNSPRCRLFDTTFVKAKENRSKVSELELGDPNNDSSNNSSGLKLRTRSALAAFVRNLWKGIALPFPKISRIFKEEQQRSGSIIGVKESIFFIIAYLVVGVGAYSFLLGEHWPIIDSLYFCVVTFTTIGYGDLSPSTVAGKIFTCFFGLGGVAFLGAALASIGSNLIQAETNAVEAAQQASRKQIVQFFGKMPQFVENNKNGKESQENLPRPVISDAAPATSISFWKTRTLKIFARLLPFVAILSLGGIAMGRLEGWSWVDSIYFSIITAGTVGYGDFSPTLPQSRLIGVVFLPLAVAAAGDVLGSIASYLLESRRHAQYDAMLKQDLTIKSLELMDENHDGRVSKREYVEFMLMEMQLVEKEQLDELHTQFARLDVTRSGYLDRKDIEMMYRSRRKQEREGKEKEAETSIPS